MSPDVKMLFVLKIFPELPRHLHTDSPRLHHFPGCMSYLLLCNELCPSAVLKRTVTTDHLAVSGSPGVAELCFCPSMSREGAVKMSTWAAASSEGSMEAGGSAFQVLTPTNGTLALAVGRGLRSSFHGPLLRLRACPRDTAAGFPQRERSSHDLAAEASRGQFCNVTGV